jgi:FkbM family methyltransferase
MVTFNDLSPLNQYWEYLKSVSFSLPREALTRLFEVAETTNWDEPESVLDLNNFAVMALIEAEKTDDLSIRNFNLEMALEALETGAKEHPLCAAHLGLLNAMIGNSQKAIEIAFSNLVNNLTLTDYKSDDQTLGLIYLPKKMGIFSESRREQLENILMTKNSYEQGFILSAEVLREANLVFYNATGLRFLTLVKQFAPKSSSINLELGLSSCFNNLWEGLTYLHKAYQLNPNSGAIVQALYLVYRYLKQDNFANYWYNKGLSSYQENPQSLEWQWCSLPFNNSFTYLPFDEGILLTVEANLKSIVTNVLLAQGDWFEKEMELWRNQLQAGMTVIDVGANVGVYTFSAAKKVENTGKVIAIEPFNICVQCLKETCKINDFSWVKLYEAAASDHEGVGKLALHNANELNEVITDESITADKLVSINLLTLDSLIETENLTQVDWLKIDAEGHEMQVLQGAGRILQKFKPKIIYENVAGSKGSNLPVAEYLQEKGYQLYYYQPYLQNLILLNSLTELGSNLNIIALPN